MQMIDQEPLVSICLLTYNHEKYIRQAVDSILNQDISFAYELLIADDASTDYTQEILKKNYSDIRNIRLILREKNSQGENAYLVFQEAKGKYIYYCEGDDYWIGKDGLQMLVEWLEKHEQYVGVAGRRITLSEKTGLMSIRYDLKTDDSEICLNDFLENRATFDMCAVLYRNFYKDGRYNYKYYQASRKVGDLTIQIYVLLHGNVFQLNKIVGVYRTDRIRSARSYCSTTNGKQMFEDHMEIISALPNLISDKIDFSKKRRVYVDWYLSTIPSAYEILCQTSYLQRHIGIKMTLESLYKWIICKR